MAAPGWYPDPGQAPGRFRYWDGTSWSATTSDSPSGLPPTDPAAGSRSPRRRGLLLAITALVLVLALAGVFVVRFQADRDNVDPAPSTSVSGGDDSSPSASATPSDSATPSPSPSPDQPSAEPCPVGNPTARQDHPVDGRVHGGGLSFPEQAGWETSTLDRGITWAYDVGGQQRAVESEWYAMYAVGALATFDGFEEPERAADTVMQCTASSSFYAGFVERRDLAAEPITVAGHQGWRIRSEIRVQTNQTTLPGDVVEVIVVDLDSPESLALFLGAVPIGDEQLAGQLDRVVSQLRAD